LIKNLIITRCPQYKSLSASILYFFHQIAYVHRMPGGRAGFAPPPIELTISGTGILLIVPSRAIVILCRLLSSGHPATGYQGKMKFKIRFTPPVFLCNII